MNAASSALVDNIKAISGFIKDDNSDVNIWLWASRFSDNFDKILGTYLRPLNKHSEGQKDILIIHCLAHKENYCTVLCKTDMATGETMINYLTDDIPSLPVIKLAFFYAWKDLAVRHKNFESYLTKVQLCCYNGDVEKIPFSTLEKWGMKLKEQTHKYRYVTDLLILCDVIVSPIDTLETFEHFNTTNPVKFNRFKEIIDAVAPMLPDNLILSKEVLKAMKSYDLDGLLNPSPSLQTLGAYTKFRVDSYNTMRQRFANMDSCLKYKGENLVLPSPTSGQDIIFKERIGSESVYGVVYKVRATVINKEYDFVAKIMAITEDNKREIEILQKTSEFLGTDPPLINFPSMYAASRCENNTIRRRNDATVHIQGKKPYYTLYTDLANAGDLQMFLKTRKLSVEECKSILRQIIYTIYMFHTKIKYTHADMHLGNFLVHKIQPGGSFKYVMPGGDVKVLNCGYVIIIWDFGLTQHHGNYCYIHDYIRVITLLSTIGTRPGYMDRGLIPFPEKVNNVLTKIINYNHTFMDTELEFLLHIDMLISTMK